VVNKPRVIAFYLPQYHPIPENDEWWGKGFTEWRNVTRATPLFRGHAQPQLPADLGFYDLRVPETRDAQAALATQYGIEGFCYYYYWFEGRKVLERPLEEMLSSGEPDFPFCICWANENWTRRWDGFDQDVLLGQRHSPESDAAFLRDVLPILQDPRYIRVDGKPLLMVYRVELMPDPAATARAWRRIAAENGIPDLHLCFVQVYPSLSRAYVGPVQGSADPIDPRSIGFDAAVEFPPHGMWGLSDKRHNVTGLTPDFAGRICSYAEVMDRSLARPIPAYRLHRGIMPAWDNTARRGPRAFVYEGSSPQLYGRWLKGLLEQQTREDGDELLFVNAWNEWAEGAHLEPDLNNGHAYLQTTRDVLAADAAERRQAAEGASWPLATSRDKRVLAWPDWSQPESVRAALGLVDQAEVSEEPDLCLCLRLDPAFDPPMDEALRALNEVIGSYFSDESGLEILLVDDAIAEEKWPLLGSSVVAGVQPSEGSLNDERTRFFAALGRPVAADASELRRLLELQPIVGTGPDGRSGRSVPALV
jgi:hypothetical protein